MNRSGCSNGINEGDGDDDNHTKNNGIININGIDNGSSHSTCSDDVLTNVCKVPKTVKFRINDNNEKDDNDNIDDSRQVCGDKDNKDNNLVGDHIQNHDFSQVKVQGSAVYEKEEGNIKLFLTSLIAIYFTTCFNADFSTPWLRGVYSLFLLWVSCLEMRCRRSRRWL